MIGMSFAPQTFGGHEDYQSESNANNGQGTSKILGAAGIQVPQTFMSKYQAQLLDSQKQNSGYKKRGDLDDSTLQPEMTIGDHQVESKGLFSIYAISGYCDQPLSAVERLTFKFSQTAGSPLLPT